MTDLKSVQIDPYDAVLSDLRSKREEIDKAIAMLENLRDGRLGVAAASPAGAPSENAVPDAGAYLGMSIADAAKKLLLLRKRKMANAEILRELQAGGLVLTGADPLNVVGSVLTRRFNNVGDIVRVDRGVWGLKEWYPGRTFKSAGKAAQTEVAPDEAALGTAASVSGQGSLAQESATSSFSVGSADVGNTFGSNRQF